jgi:hypothetical protein
VKKCPLCAELVQDEAVRCKHCGGNIGAINAASAATKSKAAVKNAVLTVAALFGGFAGYVVAAGATNSGLKTFGGAIVGAILFPIGWQIGGAFGKMCQPTAVFDTDVVRMGARKLGYAFLPLLFSAIGGLVSLYGVVKVVGDEPTKPVVVSGSPAPTDATGSNPSPSHKRKKKGGNDAPLQGEDQAQNSGNASSSR